MKKLLLCLFIIALPLLAEEIYLGMVSGAEGNSLILVDGKEIKVSNLSLGKYVTEKGMAIDDASITFPFTASLVINDALPAPLRERSILVKIHKFYDVVDEQLVERKSR